MLNNGFPSSYKIYSSNIEDALFLVNIAYFREDSKGFWSEVYQELGISERGLEYQQEKVRAHLYESFKVTMQKENLYLDESFKDVYNSVMAHTFVPVNKIDDFMLYVNKFYQNNLNEELNFFKAEEELKRILLETKCDFYFLPVGSRKIISSMESLFVQYFLESLEYLDILMTERDDISEVREIRKRAIEKWFKKLKDGFFDVEEEREEREEKEPRVTIKSNYTGKKSKKTKPIFPNEKPEKVNEPTFFFESGKLSLRFPKMDIPSRKNGENIAHPYLMFVNQRIRLEPKFDNIQKIFKLKEESYPLEDANTGMLELKYGLKQKTYESWDFKAIFFKKGKGVSLKARRGDEVYEVEGIGVVNVIYNKEWKLRIDGLKAESFPVDGNDYLVYSQMELNKNIGYLEGRGRVYQIKSKI